jgi:hypothetical protein
LYRSRSKKIISGLGSYSRKTLPLAISFETNTVPWRCRCHSHIVFVCWNGTSKV